MSIPQYVDLPFIKNLAGELLNSVSKYNNKGNQVDDTRLYERKTLLFRDIIDSVFPSMLVINYSNIKKELSKYSDIVTSLKGLLGQDYTIESNETFDFNRLSDKEIDILLDAITNAEKWLLTNSTPITSKQLQQELSTIISSSSSNVTILKNAKALFNKVYALTDTGSNNKFFIFPTFSILTGRLQTALDIGIGTATGMVEKFRFDSVGQLLDFGHTAVGYSDGDKLKLQFNSPKLFGILYDIVTSTNTGDLNIKALTASTKFLQETKQTEEFIEIEKDFSEGFLKLFISIGGNVVRFENSIINQRRGSVLETKERLGTNTIVLQRLKQQFLNIGGKLAATISRSMLKGRGSPSMLDYIKYNLISAIEGKPVQKFKNKTSSKLKNKSKVKMPVLSGIGKSKPLPRIQVSKATFKPNIQITTNLTNLERLLNMSLVQRVKDNMGRGNRTDVLNLQTGRFAESVKVERLSESRQGMITAFYSYMKNPYATFSTGGKQQDPKTRDPKLLIAKSIRELAQQQVANRLRAVVI